MRKSLIAGVTAGALVLAGLQVPSSAAEPAQSVPTHTQAGNDQAGDLAASVETTADAFEKLSAQENSSSSNNKGATSRDDTPKKPGDRAESLEWLDQDPENDPLYIDPEKNPLKEISSSDMFLEWTDGMEEGDGKDFVQAWARNSSVPDTANPVELWKQEAQGSAMMSSGFFTGDFAQSSAGSSQATSVLIPVFLGVFVIGSLIELVMRGIRMVQQ